MNQKEKRRHLFRVFLKSKGLFACFSIVLSLLLVVGSTYAWITSADERVNRADANQRKVAAFVVEDFKQVFHWAPGTTKEKNIRVQNTGEAPALVRISLKEYFVGFETNETDNHNNQDGNGNLKVYGTPPPGSTMIDVKDTATWAIGNTYTVSASKYYQADTALVNRTYLYKGARTEPLPKIVLNFQAGKVFDATTPPGSGDSDYWYYEKGFFYYSEVLQPGDETPNLLDSISLDTTYVNQYKGAIYKLVPEMDAHDLTKELLTSWGITSGDYVRTLYQDKLH